MKRNIIITLAVIFICSLSGKLNAQDRMMNVQEYEKKKMEYIIQSAGLTPEEAQKYFPLNLELSRKRFEMNRRYRANLDAMENRNNLTTQSYRQMVDGNVDLQMKEAELLKEYSEKFNKVLSPEKVYRAQQAEKEFMKQQLKEFRSNNGNNSDNENRGNNANGRGRGRR